MKNAALVVIDLQNDITKNYKEIIGTTNQAIDWAVANNMDVVYIQHNNLSAGTRTFKPDTRGAELVPELNFYQDKEQCFNKRRICSLYPETQHHRVFYRRCRCHSLRKIHLLQHVQSRICRSCFVRLHHKL